MRPRQETDRAAPEPEIGAPSRPQSPASRGLRAGLAAALAAVLLVLAANDSWLLPSLDADGVAWFEAAGSLATRGRALVPVAPWSSADSLAGLDRGPALVPWALAALVETGTRTHVAALWFVAGSVALLVLAAGWAAGGAAGVGGGVLAAAFLLASPMAVEAGTALRPEPLAAAWVLVQLGAMAYRPRGHLAHGAAGSLAWAAHPAGAGALAAAVLWPLLRARPQGGGAAAGAALAAAPAVLLLGAGPAVAWLPSLPPVVGQGVDPAAVGQLLSWAGAGQGGLVGRVLGLLLLAGTGALVFADASATPPVDPTVPWHDPRAPDLVAGHLRRAGWLVLAGLLVGVGLGGASGGLERPGLLLAAPVAVLAGAGVARWAGRAAGASRWVVATVAGGWLLLSGVGAAERHREIRAQGRGVAQARWIEAESIRWLDNRIPRGRSIYASDPWLVVFQTGRATRTLPPAGSSLDGFVQRFGDRPGVVVLVGADTARAEAFSAALPLTRVAADPGAIVLAPDSGAADAGGASSPPSR